MDFGTVIKNQTHAALTMLTECVENCPEAVWLSGTHPRPYWKIAYHAAAYADCFLSKSFDSWEKWTHHRPEATWTFSDDSFEIPVVEAYTTAQVMEYIGLIREQVDKRVDSLDLKEMECGIPWYPGLPRAELLVLNVRHISEHVGQMHEIRIAAGLDVDWCATRKD